MEWSLYMKTDRPTGDVCSNQYATTAAFEFAQSAQTLALRELTMQRHGRKTKQAQHNSKAAGI